MVDRLLELPFPGRDEIVQQVAGAKVRDVAGDGDHKGSIEFKIYTEIRTPVESSVPVEARGFDEDGIEVDFLLHIKDGVVQELEVLKANGSPIVRRPGAETLEVRLLSATNKDSR